MDNYSKLQSQLSKEQVQQFSKISTLFQSDEKTKLLALQYLIEYKENSVNLTLQKMQTLAKCSFFIAQKSQYLYNIRGQRINGIGLSLNQIIKSYTNIDEFILTLKDYVKKIRFPDNQVENDINGIIKKIGFGFTFYKKFEKTLKKIEFSQKISESYGYSKTFTSFIWLLFIDARLRIYKNSQDLIQNTCLLVAVFYFMIRYTLDYMRSNLSDMIQKSQIQKKQLISQITEKLFQLFKIQDFQTYKNVVSAFDDYFQKLIQNSIIKNSYQKTDFFCPELININYKRLDSLYQKTLTLQQLDQRFFLKQRIMILTPSKITPFSRQGPNSKVFKFQRKNQLKIGMQNQNPNKQFSSHRILSYDILERDQNLQKTTTTNELKFPKNVMFSPSLTKTPLICATPVTMGMQMYNYLNQKSKLRKDLTFKLKKYDNVAIKLIEQIIQTQRKQNLESIQEKKTRQIRFNLIYSFYKIIVQQYYTTNPYEKQTQEMHRCFVVLSAQTICFVCNVTTIYFKQIIQLMQITMFDLWKANEFLIKFDKMMPSRIRSHFIDLQDQIISYNQWKEYTMTQFIEQFAEGKYQYENKYDAQNRQRFVKKLFNHISFQITSLSNILKLEQKISEYVFIIIKHILANQADLLLNRHIDQMIICGFYAVCKSFKLETKFIDIKDKYEQLNQNNKNLHNQIICNILISENERANIIKFYNTVYVPRLKSIINALKSQNLSNLFKNNITLFQITLKQLIPKDYYQAFKRNTKIINGSQYTTNIMNQITYNNDYSSQMKTNLVSKKMINFDEPQQISKPKKSQMRTQPQVQQQDDFISQKFKKPTIIKKQKQLHNTPRMNSYSNMLHNSNICQTEKIKFKEK